MRTPYAFYLLVTGATGRDQGSSAGAGGSTLALSTATYRLIDSVGRAAHGVIVGWRRWRAERTAARHLARLDDHLLRDIGLERDQIEAAVGGNLRRRARVVALAAPMTAADKVRSEVERLAA